MPSALELIRAAQIERPDATALAEARERQTPPSTQIKVVSVGANGITGTTTNGGELTVFSGAQNFTPRAGDILPVNFTAGVARAIDNSRPETTVAPSPPSIPIVNTRAPTTDDGTTPYQLWYDISPGVVGSDRLAELWALLPQLGAWHKISGQGGPAFTCSTNPPPGGFAAPIDNTNAVLAPYSEGHQWIHTGIERTWTLCSISPTQSKWIGATRNFYQTPNPAYTDSLVPGDILAVYRYQWVWDGTDWQVAYCCEEGFEPEDPPPWVSLCADLRWRASCPGFDPTPPFDSGQFWTCGCV